MMLLASFNVSPDFGLFGAFYLVYFGLIFALHFILASATFTDARLQQARGGGLFLVGPTVWFITVLLTGLLAVALYWVIHHSRLRSYRPPSSRVR